jgi:hypothetical protein
MPKKGRKKKEIIINNDSADEEQQELKQNYFKTMYKKQQNLKINQITQDFLKCNIIKFSI